MPNMMTMQCDDELSRQRLAENVCITKPHTAYPGNTLSREYIIIVRKGSKLKYICMAIYYIKFGGKHRVHSSNS